MLLNDKEIYVLATCDNMIFPFSNQLIKETIHGSGAKAISFGLSSFGYDLSVRDGFKMFTPLFDTSNPFSTFNPVIDPKGLNEEMLTDLYAKDGDNFIIVPPHSFCLAESVEYFKVPDDVLCVVVGKSTYARCGIITNVTPLEPGWEGTVTLEISNTTPLPAKIYINEGLCQVLFLKGNRPRTTYGDRKGKYQKQIGITLPKV